MASICMLLVWRLHPVIPLVFWLLLTFVEGIYLTSVLYKVTSHLSCLYINMFMRSNHNPENDEPELYHWRSGCC